VCGVQFGIRCGGSIPPVGFTHKGVKYTMKRRNVLAALGMMSGGAAIASGTGAFTSVAADRDVAVEVAGDADAYLALTGIGPNDEYVTTTNGELGLDLTGSNPTGAGGQGVNADAITVIEDVIEVRNQGTQEVEVEATPLTFIKTSGGDTLTLLLVPNSGFPSVTIGTGQTEIYSVIVDDFSPGGSQQSISDTVTFTAEATQ